MSSSALYPNELVIDDSTSTDVTHGGTFGRGLELPFGASYEGAADPFPAELLIPESEWQARIQEAEARGENLSARIRGKIPEKNQDRLNYCWIFGPTQAAEVKRFLEGLEYVSLSPASVGAQVKNFKNVGGWGREGLEFAAEHGWVPSATWPDTALDRSLLTDANKQLALDFRVTEWTVLAPRNKAQLVSMLLRLNPVAVGYNWWSHEVLAVEPVWLDGTVALRIRNQWKGWGDQNFAVLQGSKMIPDDAVSPRVIVAK
jgi:hypothetical protein